MSVDANLSPLPLAGAVGGEPARRRARLRIAALSLPAGGTGLLAFAAIALAACTPTSTPAPRDQAATPPLETACAGRDRWGDAAPPAHIFGNTYYVGTCGISVILITSPQGHVLIDGAVESAVPSILANIRALGFDPRDVRILLNTHEHVDHAGGLAALKAATGAQMVARAPGRGGLESGQTEPGDPQLSNIPGFTGVAVDRIVGDGDVIRVGPIAVTAVATPGHTLGGTSWRWQSCEGTTCHAMLMADSLNAIAAGPYRFDQHPDRVAQFTSSFARVAALPCDILLTGHPASSNLFARLAGRAPLVDPAACGPYVAASRARLERRQAEEAASPAPVQQ
jgi:metallo-beta-lactamase class B